MNPLQRLGVKISNWWRGEPQDSGGVVTLNSPSFLERIGLKRKGKPTSEVTYFTCLKMLSETLAKMPIKYYQKTDKGIIEAEATDTSKLLSKRPNPFMTPTTFWNTVEINRNHYGNAYVYIRKKFDRKKYGGEIKIVDLWVMQSNCVQIVVEYSQELGVCGMSTQTRHPVVNMCSAQTRSCISKHHSVLTESQDYQCSRY